MLDPRQRMDIREEPAPGADGAFRPRLRPLDAQWHEDGGQRFLVLRDRLGLSPEAVLVPPPVALLLSLCDGTRDLATLRAGFELRTGTRVSLAELDQLFAKLDAALLLESPRADEAHEAALEAYRAAPHRPLALADRAYPAAAAELEPILATYVQQGAALSPPPELAASRGAARIRGVLTPHIDYQRGGPVYGQVWARARAAAAEAELAIAFGTDHAGSAGTWTLTSQHYATPWGVLPTERDLVSALAAVFGPAAFAEELHHHREHSLELALVWLHYVREGRPLPVVPILCGSFHEYTQGEADPETDERYAAALDVLREAMATRRTLVVVGADLAHVGPAFGDPVPLGPAERARVRAGDVESLGALCAGDAAGLLAAIRAEGDARRVCGLPPAYFALRLLAPTTGAVVAYDCCPADAQGGSWVTVAGALLA